MTVTTSHARPFHEVVGPIVRAIESSRCPLITSHVRLDGDALGAELGLTHILKARGVAPHIVNDGEIPQIYRFIPGADHIGTSPQALRGDYDLAILLDGPTWERTGGICDELPSRLTRIIIDHHLPVGSPNELAWADTTFSSVGEMLFRLAREAGWAIPPEAATCLYVAIVTDTGRFTFSNTTPGTLCAAAELMELGADHGLITKSLYQSETESIMKLRAEIMQRTMRHAGGRIAVSSITCDMLRNHGVDPIDTQEMADIPRCIEGVSVGVLLREMTGDNQIKISLRSQDNINIEPVARKLGGGGHKEAAGCKVPGDLATVERMILTELTDHLDSIAPQGGETRPR